MKRLFAYIRVSTPKQGRGVSLKEQRAAIEAYAARTGAEIIAWFEEKRTAAKAGRPEFARMVKLLRQGKAEGVVIHKVDRSTRNFRDWADIDELIESGVDVHFANETLDLKSRGGRLAADIQVVVAVDYIRNLREEALKGIHGRLKQGILPHHAPIGYLDCGAGKPKAIDPVRGPMIRELFTLYASGGYTLRELTAEAEKLGLRNTNDKPLRLTQIHAMLRSVFYAGVIRSARFGTFAGAHEPIVDRATFDRVQAVLTGKFVRRTKRHYFLFRRMLRCKSCRRSLIGSARKGFVYYRCSNVECPTTSIREDRVDAAVRAVLETITLGDGEANIIEQDLVALETNGKAVVESRRAALTEAISAATARLARLTDLLLDGKIDSSAHDERRAGLTLERQKLEQELANIDGMSSEIVARAREIVGLARRPVFLYESATDDQKRRLLETVLSDCTAEGKTLEFSLHEPFATFARCFNEQDGRPHWNTPRTFPTEALINGASELPRAAIDALQSISAASEITAG